MTFKEAFLIFFNWLQILPLTQWSVHTLRAYERGKGEFDKAEEIKKKVLKERNKSDEEGKKEKGKNRML
jgi:hypothetical protein